MGNLLNQSPYFARGDQNSCTVSFVCKGKPGLLSVYVAVTVRVHIIVIIEEVNKINKSHKFCVFFTTELRRITFTPDKELNTE